MVSGAAPRRQIGRCMRSAGLLGRSRGWPSRSNCCRRATGLSGRRSADDVRRPDTGRYGLADRWNLSTVMAGAAVKDGRPCDPARLLFVVYGREATRINGNPEVANEQRNRLVDTQIRDLSATTANGGALIRWSRVRAQLAQAVNAGPRRDQLKLKQLICAAFARRVMRSAPGRLGAEFLYMRSSVPCVVQPYLRHVQVPDGRSHGVRHCLDAQSRRPKPLGRQRSLVNRASENSV